MPDRSPLPISASVDIQAPRDAVWGVVGDVTRMPEWSPELRRLYAVGGGRPRLGTVLVGINRRGLAVWPTTSRVVRFEPGLEVAWKTRESGATWSYRLEEVPGGTRVTGRRELPAYALATRLLGPVIGGAAGHDAELAAGISSTLERIRATVEATARA